MTFPSLRRIRTTFLIVLYVLALGTAGVLIYETFLFARERPEFLVIMGTAPTATATATATATPVLGGITALTNLPTPIPTAVPVTSNDFAANVSLSGRHPKSGRYVAAWFPPSFSGGARESFEANKDILDEISPFWYATDAAGRLYGDRNDELVRVAHEAGVLVIPSIHNVTNDHTVVINVLSNPYIRANHVQNIVNEVLARNYDGIDIDYESLPASLRPAFSAFIVELSTALHAHGKLLTIAVHAKDCDYCGLGGFQDWVVIGQHVDRMRIMTYDYHWRGSGPGPVAPLYWVRSVAEYARSVVPPEKIFIGVPFYGYDWPPGGSARGLPWSDIEDLIDSQGLTVNLLQRDARGEVDESWFRYRSAEGWREVWYMTDDGLESKLNLVQELDLAGIAIWRIGYEKPQYWDVIRRELVEDPVLIQRAINPLLPEH
ncbi:MAG: glycoside hydrolase [Chloroflexaceae bacterium]|nr:glycoside hydrolase [Chloroflexaceae bacterium]NJO04331.1 glycoside hydrolase [Chloroflexaceae bacterium]